MRSPHRKTISLLMLVIFFVMSFGTYGFNSKWLAHELDHDRHAPTASIDHDHAPQLDAEGNPAPDPLSDAEHKLLHALNHCEQFTSSAFNGLGEPPARTAPLLPSLLTLPEAELESPFRPPRSTSLI
ncbi:MAG: hypothetical protein ABIK08_01815 [Pseudomonadota bacterium]